MNKGAGRSVGVLGSTNWFLSSSTIFLKVSSEVRCGLLIYILDGLLLLSEYEDFAITCF